MLLGRDFFGFWNWVRSKRAGNYQQLSGFKMGLIWVCSRVMSLILLNNLALFLFF